MSTPISLCICICLWVFLAYIYNCWRMSDVTWVVYVCAVCLVLYVYVCTYTYYIYVCDCIYTPVTPILCFVYSSALLRSTPSPISGWISQRCESNCCQADRVTATTRMLTSSYSETGKCKKHEHNVPCDASVVFNPYLRYRLALRRQVLRSPKSSWRQHPPTTLCLHCKKLSSREHQARN